MISSQNKPTGHCWSEPKAIIKGQTHHTQSRRIPQRKRGRPRGGSGEGIHRPSHPQFTGGHPGRCPGVWGRPGPLHPSVPLESAGPGQTHRTGLKATALVLLPHSQTLVAGLGIARGARERVSWPSSPGTQGSAGEEEA